MPRGVVDGLYEHLVTEELARALTATPATHVIDPVGDGDAHVLYARHVGREIERALDGLPREARAEQARAFASRLLEHLAGMVDADAAEAIRDQRPAPPPRQLMAVHRGALPERPTSSLATSTLLTRNRRDPNLAHELGRELGSADQVDAIVAFVTMGGVRAIEDALHALARRPDARLRLLTTTFTGTTEVIALDRIARLPNAQVKVSYDTRRTRLHAKAWLFRRATGLSTAYIGSANLTATALGPGQEWMVKVCAADLRHVIDQFEGTFETLWADPEFEDYHPDNAAHRARLSAALRHEGVDASAQHLVRLQPFPFQVEILDKLAAERALHGRMRNLVVAATGTGKTVIAAFDYARQAAHAGVTPRLLYLAHRKELLEQARQTFRHVLQDASFGEYLVDGEAPERYEHVFASIQSAVAAGLVDRLGASHFAHVIVDECHHVPARSYQAIVPRLQPRILVGLTATPERADQKSLLPDFDGHIGAELRLWSALDSQLLVPFEYYGIADGTDLRRVRWARTGYDAAALGAVYTGDHARAALVVAQLVRRVADPRAIRALGFCVSVEHARFMAATFTAAGIPALAIWGDSPDREDAPRRLRTREINVVFTCDLYNEGVDLPFVDTLLFLRPTASATLFLQQLGRGLRHHDHPQTKTSCLVLDFIGQHRDEFRFDAALSALTGIPRARLRTAVEDGFPFLPSGCTLQLEPVARTAILTSLRATLAGAVRLTAELRELTDAQGTRPRLAEFLAQTGRDLDDVYADKLGWTTLQRRAGLLDAAPEGALDDDLSRRLGRLRHVDEIERLRGYRDLLTPVRPAAPRGLSELERRRVLMLEAQLNHRGVLRAAEEVVAYVAGRPAIVREFDELREVLEDRVGLTDHVLPVPTWPLALHRHYARREIVAAVGYVGAGDKSLNLQSGILQLKDEQRELLFITLDKSGKRFSPTTRYRDYAISPVLFHWETQAAASVSRPSGRRYLDSAATRWSFYLFVRTDPDAAFAFLGPARYESHTGDRPIAITWRLQHPLHPALFDTYRTLNAP